MRTGRKFDTRRQSHIWIRSQSVSRVSFPRLGLLDEDE